MIKVPERERQKIIQNAKKDYPDDKEEQENDIRTETEAYINLQEMRHSSSRIEELFEVWVEKAEQEYPDSFYMQNDMVERDLERYKNAIELREKLDPIKGLMIELESIIGNECYNDNIQNRGPWGVLESVGRSFRYPVKYFDGEETRKKWKIPEDIPSEHLITGYYAFGANELNVMRAVYKILKHLEENYELKLPNK